MDVTLEVVKNFDKKIKIYNKMLDEARIALKQSIIDFVQNKERLELSDTDLLNRFKAIGNKLDIRNWELPNPLMPTQKANVMALVDNFIEKEQDFPSDAMKGYRELLFMMFKKSQMDVQLDVNMNLDNALNLYKAQKHHLSEISTRSVEVMKMIDEQKKIGPEMDEVFERLTKENQELKLFVRSMDSMSSQVVANREGLKAFVNSLDKLSVSFENSLKSLNEIMQFDNKVDEFEEEFKKEVVENNVDEQKPSEEKEEIDKSLRLPPE